MSRHRVGCCGPSWFIGGLMLRNRLIERSDHWQFTNGAGKRSKKSDDAARLGRSGTESVKLRTKPLPMSCGDWSNWQTLYPVGGEAESNIWAEAWPGGLRGSPGKGGGRSRFGSLIGGYPPPSTFPWFSSLQHLPYNAQRGLRRLWE